MVNYRRANSSSREDSSRSEARLGPKLQLTHMIFFDLVGDDQFFNRVPAFHFLKEQATALRAKVVAAVVDRSTDCRSCGDVRRTMHPAMEAFVLEAVKLSKDSPDALKPLIDIITEKRGYRPRAIVLYYKDAAGATQTLEL